MRIAIEALEALAQELKTCRWVKGNDTFNQGAREAYGDASSAILDLCTDARNEQNSPDGFCFASHQEFLMLFRTKR